MEELTRHEEVEIDLKEIMVLILQHAAVIVLAALCAAIFLYTDTKSKVTTVYTSTTKMYILSKGNGNSAVSGNSDLVASVLSDYQALVTSKDILEELNRSLELESGEEVVASQIAVTVSADKKIVQLSASDTNPFTSMKIANTLRDVMSQYMKSTMDIQLFDVVEDAMVGTPHTEDKAKRNAVLGGIVVACLIMGVLVVRYLIDDRIKTAEEVESKLGLCVLASIPVTPKQVRSKEEKAVRQKKIKRHSSKNKQKDNTELHIERAESEGAIL